MGGTPQLPRNMGDASGWINWCKWVEGKISFILEKLNNPFANTGFSVPQAGVVECDGQFNVNGYMVVQNTAVFAGFLQADSLTIVSGIRSLPNRSVQNAWLTNPLLQGSVNQAASNFALTTTAANLASGTFAIPAGFAAVHVDVTAKVSAFNGTASPDYLYGKPKIVRVSDGAVYGAPAPAAYAIAGTEATSGARTVADIALAPGDSIQIIVQGSTGSAGWAANAANYADVTGTLTWYQP